jgi:hypothetical protein
MASKGTCKADQCEKEVRAKGYCERHYKLWRRGKMPKPRYKTCNAEGCLKPQEGRGLCAEHLAKARAKGKGDGEEATAAS